MQEKASKEHALALPAAGASLAAPEQEHAPSQRRASRASETPHGPIEADWRPPLALRYVDVILLLIAVPIALALGAPSFGLLVGAGAWLLQRLLGVADRRAIVNAAAPGSRLGLNFVDAFARIWLLAGAIVVAGAVGSRQDGLAAALVILAAYSIAFAVRIGMGREGGPS